MANKIVLKGNIGFIYNKFWDTKKDENDKVINIY